MITLLFNAMLGKGVYPKCMNEAIILPLVKNRREDITSKDNYRGIALTSPLCKILDNIIVKRHSSKLKTTDNQFGYKKNSSTDSCSMVLKDVVTYYNRKGSRVYSCLLDASKAFDKVDHLMLFEKLRKRGLPAKTIRLLMKQYSTQTVRVSWNGTLSRSFEVSNGVRQGSVLSAYLFVVYLDDLSIILNESGIGCYMLGFLVNHLIYADDITLLSPSSTGLQKLINLCVDYASAHSIVFNSKKSECIVFTQKKLNHYPTIMLGNVQLTWKDKVKHLGHFIQDNLDDSYDINDRCYDFVYRANFIISAFRFAHRSIQVQILNTFCTSYYRCVLWNFWKNSLDCVDIKFKNAIRKIFSLPRHSRSSIVYNLASCLPCHIIIHRRFIKFFITSLNSDNQLISMMARFAQRNSNTVLGENIRFIYNTYNVSLFDCINVHGIGPLQDKVALTVKYSDEEIASASLVAELIGILEGEGNLEGFDPVLIREMCYSISIAR